MKWLEKFLGGNTLYYPGCLTKFSSKNILKNYEELLDLMKIDFIEIDKINCCGSPVLNAGYKKDFDDLVKKNKKIFVEHGVKKIITNCPACFKMLKEFYSDFEVEHFSVSILNFLKKKKISKEKFDRIVYHDPCHLGRQSGLFSEPREVLERLGFEVVEMKDNMEKSLCCGAGGGLVSNNRSLADKIGKIRIEQVMDTGCDSVVSPCTLCYKHLDANSSKVKVFEFSEVVLNALK